MACPEQWAQLPGLPHHPAGVALSVRQYPPDGRRGGQGAGKQAETLKTAPVSGAVFLLIIRCRAYLFR